MWLGGLLGLSAGILTLYFGKRFLLLFFITCQAFIFLAVSTFTADTPDSLSTIAIVGIDAVDAGWSVLIFSILMALCTSNTSATNFGIFMGFGNISMLIGNNIALVVYVPFYYFLAQLLHANVSLALTRAQLGIAFVCKWGGTQHRPCPVEPTAWLLCIFRAFFSIVMLCGFLFFF